MGLRTECIVAFWRSVSGILLELDVTGEYVSFAGWLVCKETDGEKMIKTRKLIFASIPVNTHSESGA